MSMVLLPDLLDIYDYNLILLLIADYNKLAVDW